MSSLDGRVVLITGASAGIGRAAARSFVDAGARVVAVARNTERLAALSRELGGPSACLPIAADVADAARMDAMAERVLAEVGVPNVVVANAGIGLDARFTETRDEDLRAVLETNVVGVVRTVRPFLPGMVARDSGRIVIVSSIVGKRGTPHYSAYSASKFALHGMADALRAELYDSAVTVGLVCPSSTATDFQSHLRRVGPSQKRVRPRSHAPESVAGAIVELALSGRPEKVLSLEAKLLVWANRIAPRWVDRFLGRTLDRRETDGNQS